MVMVTAGRMSMIGVTVRVGEAINVDVITGMVGGEKEGVWITGGL
jgi:hypothetical protein